jgi:hypothetical protein
MHRALAAVLTAVIALAIAVVAPSEQAHAAPAFESRISLVTASELWASWRPGCPVGPDQLRRVTASHWGFDGAVHTGEIIVNADLAGEVAAIFRDLYAQGFPIERMLPVEHYAGDDDATMADNDSSGFNCRPVTGGTAWSNHAYGRAIDINPIQNPYVRGSTVLPPAGRSYLDRSTAGTGKILAGSGVVDAFGARGWTWGGNWTSPRDYMHFERAGGPARPIPAQAGGALASNGTGPLALVWRAATGEVMQRTQTGQGWSAPSSVGGVSDATPDVVSWGPGRLDVFVLGVDGAIWHRGGSSGAWFPWERLGGASLSGPGAVAVAPDRLEVFVRGLDGALWANGWSGSAWSGWYSLGGVVTSDPDAASSGPGRIDAFARGLDGAIWQRSFEGGAWRPWSTVGGVATSGPGATSRGAAGIDLFVRGSDGALYGNTRTGGGWSGWYGLGGLLSSDPDAVAVSGVLTVVAAGAGGAQLWTRASSGSWGPWQAVPSSVP